MRPNGLIVEMYTRRGLRLWLVTRALVSLLFLLIQVNPFRLNPAALMGIIGLSIGVGFLDAHLHHERALLGNLGVRRRVLAVLFAAPAVAGELALVFVGALTSFFASIGA